MAFVRSGYVFVTDLQHKLDCSSANAKVPLVLAFISFGFG